MRPDVDGRGVEPAEERLVALAVLVQPRQRVPEHFAVEGLHPLAGEHPGVLDLLLADAAEDRIFRRVVLVRDPRVEDAPRSVLLQILGILLAGVVELFGLLFGVQVIEIAEPLVEPVHRRQELVAVAEVVLAELAGRVALRLEDLGQRRIFLLDASRRAGNPDRRHSGPHRELAHDERGASRGAAWLAVVVGEDDPFLADPIDVRRLAHHAVGVGAEIPHPDVVAEDDEDVGLRCLRLGGHALLLRSRAVATRADVVPACADGASVPPAPRVTRAARTRLKIASLHVARCGNHGEAVSSTACRGSPSVVEFGTGGDSRRGGHGGSLCLHRRQRILYCQSP